MKTIKKMWQGQQGDVCIQQIPQPSENVITQAKKIKPDHRGYVLAEGEITGHYHGIECEESDMELIKIGDRMLANIKSPQILKHQEHKAITIRPGWYEIGIVVEEDEFGDMRNVKD